MSELTDWEKTTLGKHCVICTGKKDVNEGEKFGIYPFFTCSRNHIYSNKFSFDTEALLIAGNGEVGNVEYYKGKFEAYQRTYVLDKFDINIQYIYHLLKYSLKDTLSRSHAGSVIQFIKLEDLTEFAFFYPTNNQEMVRIVSILDTIDTAIQQTQAIINKLKQLKQGLLHDLLTRGVGANGELRPCYDDAPHLYKESPLGSIPNDWECVATRDLCSIITKGTTPSAGEMWQGFGGVPFLRVDNLYFDGSINFQASNFRISANTHSGLLSRSMCIFNDVLMNIVGPPLGKLGLIDESLGSANINQAIAMFRPTNDVISQYLLIWLSGMIAKEWLRCRAKQTSGQVNLTLELCQQLPIPKISISEQQRIVDQLQAMKQKINYEASYLNKLEQNKTALMDDLLTGRIRVTSLLQAEASSA